MPKLQRDFCYNCGLANDVMSTSHDVHCSGNAFELVPIPGYIVDGISIRIPW